MNAIPEFLFIGYSIRERFVRPLKDIHKPVKNVITMDTLIMEPHPVLNERSKEIIEGYHVLGDSIRYSKDLILKLFSHLSEPDKKEYAIFGYAIEESRALDFYYESSDPNVPPLKKFAYAIVNKASPSGELKGYDVIDAHIEWISALTNCGDYWPDAEQCGEINQDHLFSEYCDALCFRDKADILIEAHSPFSVVAIYQVTP